MHYENPSPTVSKGALWAGRILSALPALFLLLDAAMKLAKPDFVVKPTVEMGFSEDVIIPLGVVLLVSTILYLLRPTAVLGAILLTGYLGGAVATHVHAGHGAFQTLFPTLFGAALWGGLVLRDSRLRSLLPWRASDSPAGAQEGVKKFVRDVDSALDHSTAG